MYSQLPSITEGRSSIRNLRTRRAVVTGSHLSQYADNRRKNVIHNLGYGAASFSTLLKN
jgi:hypothetical protein